MTGWNFLLSNCLSDIADRSEYAQVLHTLFCNSMNKPQSCSGALGSSKSSPRARARHNRGRLTAFFSTCFASALGWLRSGGVGSPPPFAPLPEWQDDALWRGCASQASRAGPLDFSADKRGRCMDLLDSLLEDTDAGPHIHFSPDPKCWGYEASAIGTTPKDLIASRLAMPTQAAIFEMDSWLSSATREKWDNPERAVGADEKIPRGFFKVDMREWRKVVRRAHRAGLFVPINANVSPSHMAAGAFPVPKDVDKDRFIGDRRPRNFIEASIGRVGLPYAPRLRRILLRHKHGLSISIRDIKNFFPILGVKKSRLHKQVIGPRVPLSWLENIADVELDDVDANVEDWMFCDLWSHKHVDVDEDKYVQIAVAGVIQGDLNAVYVAEECHRNFLISEGIIDTNMILMPGKVFPRSFLFGDV